MKTIEEIRTIKEKVGRAYLTAGAATLVRGHSALASPTATVRGVLLALMIAVALAISVVCLTFVAGTAAYAQQGGGDVVQSALQKAIDWLSGLMIALGTLGFLISVCVKAVAGTNEGRHHMAHMGMAGAAIAVVAGLLAPGIMEIVAGFAGQ